LTCGIDFNIVWSKLMAMTKLNHFKEIWDQIKTKKKLEDQTDII